MRNHAKNYTENYNRSLKYDHTKKYSGFWKFGLAIPFNCEGHEIDEETIFSAGTKVAAALMGAGGFGDTVYANFAMISPEMVCSHEDALVFRGELPEVPAELKPQILEQLASVATTATGHRWTAAQFWDGDLLKFTFAVGGGLRPVHLVNDEYQFIDPSKN